MARLNLRLCMRLLPATAVVASSALGRGVQRASYYQHRRPAVAFSWSSRGGFSSGESPPAERTARPHATQSEVKSAPETQLRELAAVSPSLLASVVAVASDVDGTLTTPDVTVSPRTVAAIKAVMDSGLLFFPATGKVRGERWARKSGWGECTGNTAAIFYRTGSKGCRQIMLLCESVHGKPSRRPQQDTFLWSLWRELCSAKTDKLHVDYRHEFVVLGL